MCDWSAQRAKQSIATQSNQSSGTVGLHASICHRELRHEAFARVSKTIFSTSRTIELIPSRQVEFSPLAKYTFEAVDALDTTDLEYTRIVNGWFLDYFGMPHWKTSLHPWINVMNMEGKWAVIPGDGTASATFITTQDLGRFIGRLIDAPVWDKESTIVGNEMEFNKLIALAEEIRGALLRTNMR